MKKIVLLFFIFPILSFGQWTQQGSSVQGEALGDSFGYDTAFNAAGDVMIAGAYDNNANGDFAGHARVFEWDGADWVQRGTDIDGNLNEWSGFRVAMDDSGDTIAITSIYGVNQAGFLSGTVSIYDWNGSVWIQRGNTIEGVGDAIVLEWFGAGLDFSADGNTVAIGGPSNLTTGFRAGFVRVFEWNGSEWSQLGDDILGEEAYDEFGYAISLSDSGETVAIGAQGNFDFGNNQEGYVKILEWDGVNWNQLGSTLSGELDGDEFGRSLSISALGDVIAIGAPGYEILPSNLDCNVYVFSWDGTDWAQRGPTFVGLEDIDRFGSAVSLNSSGSILAVGAPSFSGGIVQIYEWTATSWEQIGDDILGEDTGDLSGSSLGLNSSGNTIAIAAWANDDNGQVRIFNNPLVLGVEDIDELQTVIKTYPNPTNGIVTIGGVTEMVDVAIIDLNGRKLFEKVIYQNVSIDLTTLPTGMYMVQLRSRNTIQTEKLIKQ